MNAPNPRRSAWRFISPNSSPNLATTRTHRFLLPQQFLPVFSPLQRRPRAPLRQIKVQIGYGRPLDGHLRRLLVLVVREHVLDAEELALLLRVALDAGEVSMTRGQPELLRIY